MSSSVWIYGPETYPRYIAALERVFLSGREHLSPEDGFSCDGLLLPGGGDILGALDREEQQVIQYYISHGKPVLGICRGMQALNVFFGGTLYRHISGHQEPSGDILHPACGMGLFAACNPVNSNHHQAVCHLGRGLTAEQWAPDGIVEGIRHRELPILGVQWHPERLPEAGDIIFNWLKEAIRHEGCQRTESGAGPSLRR